MNEKSDVYSLGIVLWELTSRKLPFIGVRDIVVLSLVVREDKRPDLQQDCPELFSSIFTQCWNKDPCMRPSAHEVYEHFINNYEAFEVLKLDSDSNSMIIH